jgi:hypothetical protein
MSLSQERERQEWVGSASSIRRQTAVRTAHRAGRHQELRMSGVGRDRLAWFWSTSDGSSTSSPVIRNGTRWASEGRELATPDIDRLIDSPTGCPLYLRTDRSKAIVRNTTIRHHGVGRAMSRLAGRAVADGQVCGGAMRIIACIEDPAAIEKMLAHLGRRAPGSRSFSDQRCGPPARGCTSASSRSEWDSPYSESGR